ncbi:MAG: hypothetical protein LQ349_000608 [Xanthoria aureola]|nr:MAG: hypothetical protein LQ349_000608 [Xanthoria aureola]
MAPSSKKPSGNPYEALANEQAQASSSSQARGSAPPPAQGSAPPHATVDAIAAGLGDIGVSNEAKVGTKRGANTSPTGERPPKTNLGAMERCFAVLQAARDRNAAKRAQQLAATTAQSASQQKESDAMTIDPPKESFKYNELPKNNALDFCAFGDLDKQSKTPWLVGNVGKQSTGYGLLIRFDVGLTGFPSLILQLRSALQVTEKPYGKGDAFGGFQLQWTLPPPKTTWPRLEEFTYQDFGEWIKDASPDILALPQIEEVSKHLSTKAVVVSCKVPQGVVDPIGNSRDLWNTPDSVSNRVHELSTREQARTNWFIFVPKDISTKRDVIPMFATRVNEGLGMLSQYWDADGNYLLHKLDDAPTVNQVGNGMYVKDHGEIHQLQHPRFFTPVESLQVFMGITVARESQHIQAAHTEFENIELKCFVKSLRFLSYGGNITNRSDSYLVYVRMPYSENRQVAPEVNTKVSIEWIRGIGHQHPPEERKHQLASGFVVQRHPQELIATAADFCILVQHEAGQRKPVAHELLDRDDKKTVWARLTIYFDETLAQKQLDAVNNFCTSHREPVKRLRALMQAGQKLDGYRFDVRGPNIGPDGQQNWEDHIQALSQRLNPSQVQVISKMSDIEDGVMAVEGPPGTGKTQTLQAAVWTALQANRKILIVGPSNTSLDNACRSIFKKRPMDEWAHAKKVIRLESTSREKNILMQELGRRPSGIEDIDDVRLLEAIQSWLAVNENEDSRIDELEYILRLQREDLAQLKTLKKRNERVLDYPVEFMLTTHIKKLVERNKLQAEHEFNERRGAAIMDTDLPDVADINKSARYSAYMNAFAQGEGRLGKKGSTEARVSKKELYKLRVDHERQVIAEADILVATPETIASQPFQEFGFNPSMVIFEEAGQMLLPAFCQALMAFSSWESVISFGDWKQLRGTLMSRFNTECWRTSEMSHLELMARYEDKLGGRNMFTLNEQYRMCPPISQFPSLQFYSGKLHDHGSVTADVAQRQLMRAFTRQHYGILPGQGSELMWLDVPMSQGQREPNGLSVQNYGNANAINQALQRLAAMGADPKKIVILTIYKAQLKLLAQKIQPNTDGSLRYAEICTVDSFQGREADFIIADFVIGERLDLWGKELAEAMSVQKTMRKGDKPPTVSGEHMKVTIFARDFHRLCVALTRAKYGMIIVAQIALFLTVSDEVDSLRSTMANMAIDAQQRGLVYSAWDIEDDHPKAVADREQNAARYRVYYEAATVKKKHLEFLNKRIYSKQRTVADKPSKPAK